MNYWAIPSEEKVVFGTIFGALVIFKLPRFAYASPTAHTALVFCVSTVLFRFDLPSSESFQSMLFILFLVGLMSII
jgi:hypothetical protein